LKLVFCFLVQLASATVINEKTGLDSPSKQRTSESSWLASFEDRLLSTLDKRLEAITGLSMKSAEDLQIAYYNPGGHYEPHFDFKDVNLNKLKPCFFFQIMFVNRHESFNF